MNARTVTAEALTPGLVRNLTHQGEFALGSVRRKPRILAMHSCQLHACTSHACADVLEYFGCTQPGSCMDLFQEFVEAPNWRCDTEVRCCMCSALNTVQPPPSTCNMCTHPHVTSAFL